MAGEFTRAALCHLFMSRWFRVRFERRLAAASGLTLTEVGSNADGQVPVESCADCTQPLRLGCLVPVGWRQRSRCSAVSAHRPKEVASGTAASAMLMLCPPSGQCGRWATVSSSSRTLWWCWPGAEGACLLCLSGLCGGGTRRRVGAPRTENYLELRAAEGAAIR